ncbi:DNA-binding domain-containing protein [Sunxiuqinia elliptica]
MDNNKNQVGISLFEFPIFKGRVGMIHSKKVLTNRSVAQMLVKNRKNYQVEELEVILDQADSIRTVALMNGHSVYCGFVKASPEVSGFFENQEFDLSTHSVRISYSEPFNLKQHLSQAVLKVFEKNPSGPSIFSVWDNYSCSIDNLLTSCDALHVFGLNLRIESSHDFEDEAGVFFYDVQNPEIVKRADELVCKDDNELIVRIPYLSSGDYVLKIVTQFDGDGSFLDKPVSAVFKKVLTVL